MLTRKFFTCAFVAGLFIVCAGAAFAQQGITPEKKALIQEMRELTGTKGFRIEQKFDSSDIGKVLTNMIEKDKELTNEQKLLLRPAALEAKDRLEKTIGDFVADPALSNQLFDDAFINLYDQTFTESELQEMVVFYRTPTGRKSVKFLSTVVDKATKAFSEAFKRKFGEFVQTRIDEEVRLLQQKIKEFKTKSLDA